MAVLEETNMCQYEEAAQQEEAWWPGLSRARVESTTDVEANAAQPPPPAPEELAWEDTY